jgi:hypothetical protein
LWIFESSLEKNPQKSRYLGSFGSLPGKKSPNRRFWRFHAQSATNCWYYNTIKPVDLGASGARAGPGYPLQFLSFSYGKASGISASIPCALPGAAVFRRKTKSYLQGRQVKNLPPGSTRAVLE